MLTQIVRPLVQTQIRLLANSEATQATLVETIARWLSYLGVKAQVQELKSNSDQIQVTLTVGKPESCATADWNQILNNLQQDSNQENQKTQSLENPLTATQQRQLARLLAYLIQIGNESEAITWESIAQQLEELNLPGELMSELQSALKVKQLGDNIIAKLSPDLAAIALPIIVKVALLDEKINPAENEAITQLLSIIK